MLIPTLEMLILNCCKFSGIFQIPANNYLYLLRTSNNNFSFVLGVSPHPPPWTNSIPGVYDFFRLCLELLDGAYPLISSWESKNMKLFLLISSQKISLVSDYIRWQSFFLNSQKAILSLDFHNGLICLWKCWWLLF
jgi:hypothetical protein